VAIRWHVDDPELLAQAIVFTAQQTGLAPRLVEKDYFCSVVLEALAEADPDLTFRGGTCLAKVHSDFYRLSEDLDFTCSIPSRTTRRQRSQRAERVKARVRDIPELLPGLRVVEPLSGTNESAQYNGVVGYTSLLAGDPGSVRVEVALREPTLEPTVQGGARTALLNPIDESPLIPAFPVACLTYRETMAEKLRAGLTRREVAIRDFFDVEHATRRGDLDVADAQLLELLRRKLEVPGTPPVDLSPARVGESRGQRETELRPVLRGRDFDGFDLEHAIETVGSIARRVGWVG
jgi:predicted nucleotidyltransferase component of viral defense system